MVVDAGVWVSILVPSDAHHAAGRRWLEAALTEGRPLVIPVLALAEVSGAIARVTGRPQLGHKAIDSMLAIPTLRVVAIEHAVGLTAARLAADHRLRGADATYAAVAAELKLPLLSWDREQRERAAAVVECREP
jgi:predicted nucleic acid-binding protein